MLVSMAPNMNVPEVRDTCDHFNHIVHGDPVAAESNLVPLSDGSLGYSVGKVLHAMPLCDALATHGLLYLKILVIRSERCFPEAAPTVQGGVH